LSSAGCAELAELSWLSSAAGAQLVRRIATFIVLLFVGGCGAPVLFLQIE